MKEIKHHYNITIKGHVQGVSYRFSAMIKAQKLGLTGFVKNMHNGDVYIEAEGNDEKINQLLQWCYVGPPLADVKEVAAEEKEMKNFKTFEIKR